jgi:tetratricopeptide (TPR) repeat protein
MRHVIAIGAWLLAATAVAQSNPDLEPAKALLGEKRLDEALTVVEAALAAHPDDPRALGLRAEIHRRAGRHDAARVDYERLTVLRPTDADAFFWLGTVEFWLHHKDSSAAAFGRALELSPCYGDARKGRARLRRSADDLPGAEADLREALRCKPTDLESTEMLSDVLVRAGRSVEAEALVNQAFTGQDRERRLGDLALAGKRYDEAAGHFRRALAGKPEDASLLRRLGDAERERGKSREALEAYERAVALDPADSGSQYWIGVLGYRLGRTEESGRAFDAILSRKPDDADALIGKARILRADGRPEEALLLVDRALRSRPDSAEARVLRGALLSALGRSLEARREYGSVLARHPQDEDASLALDRVGSSRALGFHGRRSQSELIEGLEDEGLEVDGQVIRTTRLEYLNESAGGDFRYALSDALALDAGFAIARESVTNMDQDRVIYDFDVTTATAGLDHRWGTPWRFSWRAGATRYEPREAGTIDTDSRFRGSAQLDWVGAADQVNVTVQRAPFIHRGFGASTLFRIFDQDRATLSWTHELGRRLTLSASGGISHFDDGNTPVFGSLALGWSRGDRSLILRLGHEPFPSRFLTRDTRELTFIDYDVAALSWDLPLAAGFITNGEARLGRFGATERTIVSDVDGDGILDRVSGPEENNVQVLVRPALLFSPPRFDPLRVGVRYYRDDYDFDTGDYNNRETRQVSLVAELVGDVRNRFLYSLRYAHDLIDDERDSDYEGDFVEGRLEAKLGRLRTGAGSVSVGVEGRLRQNDLDERSEMAGVFVTLPF